MVRVVGKEGAGGAAGELVLRHGSLEYNIPWSI